LRRGAIYNNRVDNNLSLIYRGLSARSILLNTTSKVLQDIQTLLLRIPFEILEPKTGEHVPGTVLLELETEAQRNKATNLKKGTGRHAHVVLVPQPSDDPNDPLNCPLWQRDMILLLYCVCTALCMGGDVARFGISWSSAQANLIQVLGPFFHHRRWSSSKLSASISPKCLN
jgi:hypothetical protein